MYPENIPAKFEVRSFTRSWDNRGYSKNLDSPWIRPRSIFSQNFKGLLIGWTLWIYLPNLNFVALSVPEIIGGTQKKLGSPCIRPHSIFSQIFTVPPITSGTHKAKKYKFGRYIHSVHANKSPLRIWEKRERWRVQGLPKFFQYPLLSQECVKLRTSNLAGIFTASMQTKNT